VNRPGAIRTLMVSAALTLVSIVFDVIAAASSDRWPAAIVISDVLGLVGTLMLLWSRHPAWGGLLVGVLAWDWALVILYGDNAVADYYGPGHATLVIGNLIGVAAVAVGVIGLLLCGYVEVRRVWARVLGAVILALLTVPLGIEGAYMLTLVFGAHTDTANGWIVGIGFVGGLVVPLFAGVRPEWAATRLIAVGWLIEGFIITITVYGKDNEGLNPQVTIWLLSFTGVVMLLVLAPWRTRSLRGAAAGSVHGKQAGTP